MTNKKQASESWYNKTIRIIIGICLLIVLILLPLAINHFIQMPALFDVVGEPENWLMFWPTYISAAASFLMIYATFLSLRQNRKQLDEMKRQWDDDHKKELVAYLLGHDEYYYLCIKNTSIVPINIRASVTHVPSGINKPSDEFLNNFNNSQFSIEAGGSRYFNTHVPITTPPDNSIKPKDAVGYLGIALAIDNEKNNASFELSFGLGKILKDELEKVDKKR